MYAFRVIGDASVCPALASLITNAPVHEFIRVALGRRARLCPRRMNAWFREKLSQTGEWRLEYPIMYGSKADFYHPTSGLLVEVQLGHYAFAGENLHWKFPLALDTRALEVRQCLLVVATDAARRFLDRSVAYLENVNRYYVDEEFCRKRLGPNIHVWGIDIYSSDLGAK